MHRFQHWILLVSLSACVRAASEPPKRLPPLECELLPQHPSGETPSKKEIVHAMGTLLPYARQCARDTDYDAKVVFVGVAFSGESGRVTELREGGSEPMRYCLARHLEGVCVHPFSESMFKVRFPYKLE